MYNIELEKDEQIIIDDGAAKSIVNGKFVDIAVIVTNKKIVVLRDTNTMVDVIEVFRVTKAMGFIPNYEIIFETKIENIIDVRVEEKCERYFLKDGNDFTLVSEVVYKHFCEKRS
jgi:hypothetical protein